MPVDVEVVRVRAAPHSSTSFHQPFDEPPTPMWFGTMSTITPSLCAQRIDEPDETGFAAEAGVERAVIDGVVAVPRTGSAVATGDRYRWLTPSRAK